MKQVGNSKKHAGFTIVEMMTVLAVSAGLFLVAATYISGKQARTEFQVGIRDMQTQIQQIINETASGYYGTDEPFSCSRTGSGLNIGVGGALGTNTGCIFLGKVVVVDNNKLHVYSLAGARQTVARSDTKTPVEALAEVIDTTPVTSTLPHGFRLVNSRFNGGTPTVDDRQVFAVLSSMAKASGSSIGSQTFNIYKFASDFSTDSDTSDFADTINDERTVANAYTLADKVELCMYNDGVDQSALITIGGQKGIAVRRDIKDGKTCGV